MQLAAAGYAELVRVVRIVHTQRHIVLELLVESLADLSACQVLAFLTREWRFIDLKGHADGRLVDGQGGQGLLVFRIAKRVRDPQIFDAAEYDDVTGRGGRNFVPLKSVETVKL